MVARFLNRILGRQQSPMRMVDLTKATHTYEFTGARFIVKGVDPDMYVAGASVGENALAYVYTKSKDEDDKGAFYVGKLSGRIRKVPIRRVRCDAQGVTVRFDDAGMGKGTVYFPSESARKAGRISQFNQCTYLDYSYNSPRRTENLEQLL